MLDGIEMRSAMMVMALTGSAIFYNHLICWILIVFPDSGLNQQE
jgi:hypothetical protein